MDLDELLGANEAVTIYRSGHGRRIAVLIPWGRWLGLSDEAIAELNEEELSRNSYTVQEPKR